MRTTASFATSVVWLLIGATSAVAQDLDPRAYAKVPVGFTIATAGVSVSSGGVLIDPTLPVENAHAEVWTPSVGIAQSFGLFGRTAQDACCAAVLVGTRHRRRR